MKSTMRFQAATCSGLYMPVQPGLIRPSRLTSVISVITSPAPPIARLPRWTRCQSFGVPSSAEYWHMGEQTTRLASEERRVGKECRYEWWAKHNKEIDVEEVAMRQRGEDLE